jgi:hypothetical protein
MKIVETMPDSKLAIPSAYNVACGYALSGDKAKALDWLEKSVKMGWTDLNHMEQDEDLDSLRNEERYKKLVKQLEGD